MADLQIPLIRDVKYGHNIDDFEVKNFLITEEGLRMRPPILPLFDIPFAVGDIIAGFYVDHHNHIYIAKINTDFILTIYYLNIDSKIATLVLTVEQIAINEKPKMVIFGDGTYWFIQNKLYSEKNNVFTEIDYKKGDIKPENIIDIEIMNSVMYMLGKDNSKIFYTFDLIDFKIWEFFSIISYPGEGISLGQVNNNLCIFMQGGMEVWYDQPSGEHQTFPLIKRRDMSYPLQLVNNRTLENTGAYLLGACYNYGKFVILRFNGQQINIIANAPLLSSFLPKNSNVDLLDKLVSSIFSYNNIDYYLLFFNLINGDLGNKQYPNLSFCLNTEMGIWSIYEKSDKDLKYVANYHANLNDKLYCLITRDKTNTLSMCEAAPLVQDENTITFQSTVTTDYFTKALNFNGNLVLYYYITNLIEPDDSQDEEGLVCDILKITKREAEEENPKRTVIKSNNNENTRLIVENKFFGTPGWDQYRLRFVFKLKKNYRFNFLLRSMYGTQKF